LDDQMSLGMTLFLCVFLIPFVAVGTALSAGCLLCAGGKVVVNIDPREAVVATGIGPFLWRRRFNPREVKRVGVGRTKWESNGEHRELIAIEADRTIKFGSMLSDERRDWMRAVLRVLFLGPSQQREQILAAARSRFDG
jgi:hypothetical protein